MSRQKGGPGNDVLGLALFGLAALSGVSIGMASRGAPEHAGGFEALFVGLVGWIGVLPGLALCAGLALLGARLWLRGVAGSIPRHLAGLAGVTAALSILAGAWSAEAGGALGAALGGSISRNLATPVGLLFGAAILALVTWFAWARPLVLGRISRAPQPPAPIPADAEGVSREEALALLPHPRPAPAAPEAPAPVPPIPAGERAAAGPQIQATPPSPYPPDVRVHGGIPPGARPLDPTHVPAPKTPAPARARVHPPVQPAPEHPGARGGEPAGAYLAADAGSAGVPAPASHRDAGDPSAPAGAAVAAAELAERPMAAAAGAAPVATTAAAAPVPAPVPATPRELESPAEGAELAASSSAGTRPFTPAPPRPSWELDAEDEAPQPPTVAAGEPEEEPVDAYGTPLSLVESLRRANAETVATRTVAETDEEEDAPVEATFDDDPVEGALAEDGEEPDPEEALEAGDEAEALEAELARDLEDEEDLEEDVEEELEEELAIAMAEESELAEEDEAEDEEDLAIAKAEESEPAEEDEAELEETILARDERPHESNEDEDGVDEEPADGARSAARQLSFVGEPQDPSPPAEPDPAPASKRSKRAARTSGAAAEEAAAGERQVELEPVAPPPRARAASPEDGDLVYRAGCLFLERGRVAVSMLQREFGLDFKQATALLDQLQEAGLIGPYLGGQRRDILLDAEQWRERVGVS